VVTFGLTDRDRARSVVLRTGEHLVVPAGLRSLANLTFPGDQGEGRGGKGTEMENGKWKMENGNPESGPISNFQFPPYRGRYEGDEDTSRKWAYHNGTAWAHLLPLWVEALLCAFPDDPRADQLGGALMRTYEAELRRCCVGQVSEIFDGDHPHLPRGCCAQAWAVTEALRIYALLAKRMVDD
jgi:hypothetical protein